MNGQRGGGGSGIVDIDAGEDAGPGEVEFGCGGLGIDEGEVESSESAFGHADLPLIRAPIDDAGGIFAFQYGSGGEVGIVEGDEVRRGVAVVAFDVDVAGIVVADAEDAGFLVEGVARLIEIFISVFLLICAASEGLAVSGDGFR